MNDPVLTKVGELLAEIADELDEPTPMVNNAVVLADFIDVEGKRWLRIIRNFDVKNWEVRGMLTEVLSDMDTYEVVYALTDES